MEGLHRRRATKRKRASANVSPVKERVNVDDRRPLMVVQEARSRDTQPAQSNMLHYIIGGRAGKMGETCNGLFVLQKLRNNLLPADGNENVVAGRRIYLPASYGSSRSRRFRTYVPRGTLRPRRIDSCICVPPIPPQVFFADNPIDDGPPKLHVKSKWRPPLGEIPQEVDTRICNFFREINGMFKRKSAISNLLPFQK